MTAQNSDNSLRLSVLDLSPVASGSSGRDALNNTLDLARLADDLGYHRYWLAEHHNTALIASGAPEVMIGHVASVTKRMRVGSGGVMLPNHAPLKVAETFKTLEALHPGRIDLGLGRAPGTDSLTALALRGSREALNADDFPEQLSDLLSFFSGEFPRNHPFQRIVAIPNGVEAPEVWLLGSSDFSARLAGQLGLGFAFAHHINPEPAMDSLRLYREYFRPSDYFAEPHSFVGVSVICAPDDDEASTLAAPIDLALLRLVQGRYSPLATVEEALAVDYSAQEREAIRHNRQRLFTGSPETLRARLSAFAKEAGVSELMITTMTHSHAHRRRSYELLAEAFQIHQSAIK
ncbi:N5,N10-methylene tetrahydromethanopterin reductase [Capsulimonas corticalis]|uniref:N5,N10-methylene tetrahydromethanopterin reductase n=1 Tax=Capsulimonas corticalis TaxID=2219043 RepID=A0A402CVA7_9BACT|nr:LLM class flavin-dependent oxidoreductase [Capsulimonas corticalis]BDI30338.1 N5,N10-methylene tetrahydromethanopterin reductase [Capsulimonas corticalis]